MALLVVVSVVAWSSESVATGASFTPGFSQGSAGRDGVAIGDFDGDGDADIAAGRLFFPGVPGPGVFFYENDGGHPASFSVTNLTSSGTVAIEAADLTGTGNIPEFVSATSTSILIWELVGGVPTSRSLGSASATGLAPHPPQDRVFLALGTDLGYAPVSGTGVVFGLQGAAANTYRSVAIGNLEIGGGTPWDLVAGGASGVWRCSSIGVCGQQIASGVDAYDVEVADLDGDGMDDIVAALNDELVWYEYDLLVYPGPTFFSPPQDIAPFNSSSLWTDVEVVDFDMDGDLDVVATDVSDAPPLSFFAGSVAWFENDGLANPSFTRHNIRSFSTLLSSLRNPYTIATNDVDGDGDVDVAFGLTDTFITSNSRISVYNNEFALWHADGTGTGLTREGTGTAVAGGVDINGDGFPDQLVANRCAVNAISCDSRVDLYLGTAIGFEEAPAWTAVGDSEDDRFGHVVSFVGDVNADGFQDVGVSAPRRANSGCGGSGQSVGQVYLWYGGAPGPGDPSGLGPNGTHANADRRIDGSTNTLWQAGCPPPSLDAFGTDLVGAGDVDGDGIDDMLIGDPSYFSAFCFPDTRNFWGRAYLYSGRSSGPARTETFSLNEFDICGTSCPCTGRSFGRHLAAGDIDGNGLSDVAIGVPGRNETHVYLDSELTGDPSQILLDGGDGVTLADVDGDGFDDVITAEGDRADAYLGSISGNLSTSGWTYTTTDLTGVERVGDLNGDCYDEIVLPSTSEPLAIFYGEPTASGLASVPFEIMPSPWSVAAVGGDVGSDGLDDFLVGNEVGGRYGADGGAASAYQGNSSSGTIGDCDGDGSDRANDCNDDDPTIFPGAVELCDGVDNDCSGMADDGPDSDADGPNDVCDNCPSDPNGPLGGTCIIGDPGLVGSPCTMDAQCGGAWNFCSLDQNDQDLDGVGDACDPDTLPEPDLGLLLITGVLFLSLVASRRQRQIA